MTDWFALFTETRNRRTAHDYAIHVAQSMREGLSRVAAEEVAARNVARGNIDWVPAAAARMELIDSCRVFASRPLTVRSSSIAKEPYEPVPFLGEAVAVDYGLSLGTAEDHIEIRTTDVSPSYWMSQIPVLPFESRFLEPADYKEHVVPSIVRLRAAVCEAQIGRLPEALLKATKKAAELAKSREKARSPTVTAKRVDEARQAARKSFSGVLHGHRRDLADVTAQELRGLLHLATEKKWLLKELAKWAATHPAGYSAMTEEDIAESLDLARVKEVIES